MALLEPPSQEAVPLHHNAVLVSFDADYEAIASVSELHLKRLRRPA